MRIEYPKDRKTDFVHGTMPFGGCFINADDAHRKNPTLYLKLWEEGKSVNLASGKTITFPSNQPVIPKDAVVYYI